MKLYTKVIYWSSEDNCYVGSMPELCGACCDGKTQEEVFKKLISIEDDYLNDEEMGTTLPADTPPGSFCTKVLDKLDYKLNFKEENNA